MSSQSSSVLSRRVIKMSSHVVTSVVKRSSCAITWAIKRTSCAITWVITLLLGSSQGLLWCRHNGCQIVRKWKSCQLSSIAISCHQFISPKSSMWQSCLSCSPISFHVSHTQAFPIFSYVGSPTIIWWISNALVGWAHFSGRCWKVYFLKGIDLYRH